MENPARKASRPAFLRPAARKSSEATLKREPGSVQQAVGHSHPARPTTQVTPVGESGYGGGYSARYPHNERRIGGVSHGAGAGRRVQAIEGYGRAPGSHRHVCEGRVQRQFQRRAVQNVANRHASGIHGVLHFGLYSPLKYRPTRARASIMRRLIVCEPMVPPLLSGYEPLKKIMPCLPYGSGEPQPGGSSASLVAVTLSRRVSFRSFSENVRKASQWATRMYR